ncbi:MAG: hypothetical protein GC155_12600 [Alphaproteobacteria bacterium]|nr:hypothetical protein [Alphaproteobacteria bacterium]
MTVANPVEDTHPSPHRARASLVRLIYGLVGAPLAWAVSEVASSTLAQEACFPKTEPLASPAFAGAHLLQMVILGVAFLISASAAWIAYASWRRTREEAEGDTHVMLAAGEGRSRFMALAGLLTSIGFFIGMLFSIPALIFVPAC